MAASSTWLSALIRTTKLVSIIAAGAVLVLLPFAGVFLVDEDPLEKSDLIFVLGGARVERWLEGVELYKEGWAPKLLLSAGSIEPIERQLRERGVTYPREGDLARAAVIALGVPASAVSVLPEPTDNTAAEAAAVRGIMTAERLRSVIVVTSSYHTRRAGFAFRRAFANTPLRVGIRPTRYSSARPWRWWRSRSDIRFVISELPKLAAYVVGLGD